MQLGEILVGRDVNISFLFGMRGSSRGHSEFSLVVEYYLQGIRFRQEQGV